MSVKLNKYEIRPMRSDRLVESAIVEAFSVSVGPAGELRFFDGWGGPSLVIAPGQWGSVVRVDG